MAPPVATQVVPTSFSVADPIVKPLPLHYKDTGERSGLDKDIELHGIPGKHAPASYPHYLPTHALTGPTENGGV